MGESFYIRSYSGVLEPSVCQQMIGIYEKLWKEQEEEIRKMSLCYAEDGRKLCGACDCQRLDIMQHEEFKSSLDYVMQQLLPVIDQYTSDVNLQKNQWPSDYGYENVPEVIRGEEPELRPRSNFDRFSIKGVTDWWKNKSTNRYNNLKNDGRLRTKLEIWSESSDIDIIR